MIERLLNGQARLPWLILTLTLLPILFVWGSIRQQNNEYATQQFQLHVSDVSRAIEYRLRQHEQILLGGAGLFDASDAVSRSEWHDYVERLQLSRNYPGILGVGFSQVMTRAQLPAHIAAIRAEGFPDYTVKPPGERDLYTAIVYIEPFTGRNLQAFGYDMYSEETRARAMRLAVDSGESSISGKVRLVQETQGKTQAGFLMYVPIYRKGFPHATPEQRWRYLRGFVYSPYRVEELMHGILGERNHASVDFSIYDGTGNNADALLYATYGERAGEYEATARFSTSRRIEAYGHVWTLSLFSRPDFDAQFNHRNEWVVLVLGLSISLSLFVLTASLVDRREQALKLARQMTAQIRQNEARLGEFNERLELAADSAGIGVWEYDLASQLLIWDQRMCSIYQIGLDEFNGRYESWLARLHPDDRQRVGQEHSASFKSGVDMNGSFRIVRNDGDIRNIKYAARSFRNAAGEPVRIIGVNYDVTEQQAAQEEISHSRKLLADVLKSASEFSIIATDTDGLITMFNIGSERMLAYSATEMVGRQTPAIIHLAAEVEARGRELSAECGFPVAGFQVFVHKAIHEGSEQREWTYVRKDGSHLPVSLVVTAIRSETGEITGYLGIAQDVTRRNQAETSLREQVQHTQAIVDNVVDGIITIDERGTVSTFNKAAERIFGYQPEEVVGRNVNMLMPNPYHDAHDSYLKNYLDTDVAQVIGIGREVEGRRRDGSTFPIDLAVSEIERKGARMFVGLVRDITERRRVERMKSEFVSIVSHELRTPLTSVAGALGLLAGGALGELPEEIKSLIDIAHKNSLHLTHLINDLLDMEKIAAGKMDFDVRLQPLMPLVEQALEANRSYGDQYRVRYILTGRADDVEVRVDTQRLMQVLSNFLSNAAKFSPVNSVVEIAVRRMDGCVRVEVHDHGPGIPAEFRMRIFQKFSQADSSDTRAKGGTGLGLAITKELVERMGGRVGFDSTEGQGSIFFVELPVMDAAGNVETGSAGADSTTSAEHAIYGALRRGDPEHRINGRFGLASATRTSMQNPPARVIILSGTKLAQEARIEVDTALLKSHLSQHELLGFLAQCINIKMSRGMLCMCALQRIMYVEDEPDIQAVAKLALELVGHFEVKICSSGEEALREALAYAPDLILLDVMMPGMDGPTTLKNLRQLPALAKVPIIFMTAKVQPQEIEYYQSLGALNVIPKPFDPMKLSDQVRALWESYSD